VRKAHLLATLLALDIAAWLVQPGPTAFASPNPTSVTIAGSLDPALGCSGAWQPNCAAAHLTYDPNSDVWKRSWSIPAGSYEYKAALNDAWTESYGRNTGSANIQLTLASTTTVTFYYDHKTHWVTDSVNSVIATVPGSFQTQLGCSGNWDPACFRTWLEDPLGSGTYSLETTALLKGQYQAKVAINGSWALNYGGGGVKDGPNIFFSVTRDHARVRFRFDPTSHLLTILAGHAHDNNVEWDGLRHDSRDLLYRTPGGAVPAGTPVTLRFRTFHNDVTGVKVRVYDLNLGGQQFYSMTLAATDVSCYQPSLETETCDFWAMTLNRATPDNLWYRFVVNDGSSTAFYADRTPALSGGLGSPSANPVDDSYALMFYDPAFKTPGWARDAVVYQIFPDRFRNGNPANDPKTGDPRYDEPVIALPWATLPEGYCRNYAVPDSACPWRFDSTKTGREGPRGRDYMGGDLEGITQELGYLEKLGVNVIYLNPIFWARSNHRYDTADFLQIDPALGTLEDFEKLVEKAKDHNIRVILDGVFNHMSSDSPRFNRYNHFDTVGACNSAASPYRSWFSFRPPSGKEPAACAPSTPGGNDTFYNGWFGFDSIPVITKTNPPVQDYFLTNPDSVSRYWLEHGAGGWRLDVMGDSSFPNGYWEKFRNVVKEQDPQALIIGELWQKDSTLLRYLRGDRADTTMNYRFRDAVIGFLTTQNFDSKGFADSGRLLLPSEFASRLQSVREDYPDAAYYSLMNLLDSHDTERLLWALTPGAASPADREQNPVNLADGKNRLRIASLIQYTSPGMPTIYYGDEVGLNGADDPDDRRTYPWSDQGGQPDRLLLKHYQALASIRAENPVLTAGDFRMLLADDATGAVAYGRKTGKHAAIVAINRSDTGRTVNVPVAGYLPDGLQLKGAYGVGNKTGQESGNNGGEGTDLTVGVTGGSLAIAMNPMSALLLVSAEASLTPPSPPTGLAVTVEGNAQVGLAWNPVAGAAGYNVYRSPVTGGGYVKANTTLLSATSFTDPGLKNAQIYFFAVRAVDAAGNESGASNEVSALPHLTISWANLQWPPTMTQTISALNRTPAAYGQVYIPGVTNQPGPADTLVAQLGFGPSGSNPAQNPAWVWEDAAFNGNPGNNNEFVASMMPQAVGNYDYLYRYTTTNGRDWVYADRNGPVSGTPANPGKLTVLSSGKTTPAAVPTGLRLVSASPAAIAVAWNAISGDPSLYGYEVRRSDAGAGPYTTLGLVTTGTSYTDGSVVEGATYYYVVRSVDTSWNRSADSAPLKASAVQRTVSVVFNVTVPASTAATARVYIAGSLSRLDGGLPDWNPGGVALTKVDATHWTITLSGKEFTQIEYKYALGSWDLVEKGAACSEINNRQLTLSYGSSGTQPVSDSVINWRNVAPCGN
jgi:glycosidase